MMPKSKAGNSIFKAPNKGNDMMNMNDNKQTEAAIERERLQACYDPVTNVALLEETYRIIQPMVAQQEKKNETMLTAHEKFKEEMLNLPQDVCQLTKYDDFQDIDKTDLNKMIDKVWSRMRKILSILTGPQVQK